MKIFCSKLFALVLFSIIQDSSDSLKVEMSNEQGETIFHIEKRK